MTILTKKIVVSFWENEQSRPRFLKFANFIFCLPPEIPRDIAFIPSILKRVQRWWVSWIRPILAFPMAPWVSCHKLHRRTMKHIWFAVYFLPIRFIRSTDNRFLEICYMSPGVEGAGGTSSSRLMGMCRWMGSHFHDRIDYYRVPKIGSDISYHHLSMNHHVDLGQGAIRSLVLNKPVHRVTQKLFINIYPRKFLNLAKYPHYKCCQP